jgi:glycosyltransferase involved in cell wall biosynthesis
MGKLVSVLLPYYNGSKYVKEAVESIRAQTYRDFECLLVDDGSPDPKHSAYAKELIEELRDERFQYVHKINGGLSDARNFGIARARGEYIAFIDQDDYWKPNKLERQMRAAAENPDVGLFFTDLDMLMRSGETRRRGMPAHCRHVRGGVVKGSYRLMLRENFVPAASVVFKKSLAEKAGPSKKGFVMCPDYELFLRMARLTDFYYVDESLFVYRFHDENTTRRTERLVTECLWVLFDSELPSPGDKWAATKNFLKMTAKLTLLWKKKLAGGSRA